MSIAHYTALSADSPVNARSEEAAVSANPMDMNSSSSLQNEFITLMVAQIQNQDPLNPLDGTEYVSQLAQFSQVQSMENMSGLMQNSMVLLDNMQVLSTAGLVGETVYVSSDKFELGEDIQSGKIELEHASNQVTLVVKDAYGQTKEVPLGAHGAGDVDFSIDPEELGLKPGEYTVSVKVQDGQDSPNILLAGKVEQVRIPSTGGAALVNITGVGNVPFYQITQFGA
ncbi:flagellar hook assembly protein FlgD [Enterovibrio sp. ZSDZ35]|uniref:Basal-body rod modification protein FlgD n=2 Tax=Enterovibrio TaxID=188143 RepID=A0A1T4UKL3_9GAMM|nr:MULTISPECIES: flagellar hook assembly protein FlgD [Enterovibrio]MDD1781854.1 flagellar hook assembly protein FlgD [Enterovibrio sp. ZSDZ35]PKF51200.1 flagellar basal body rod modification protein [Enterovibrio nigricans]SKA53136.1 flagellar basal-body rod modification protein FlgD [Enterovibrio nigricans DSM 22720]